MTDEPDNQLPAINSGLERLTEVDELLGEVSARFGVEKFVTVKPGESLVLDTNTGETVGKEKTLEHGFKLYDWYPERYSDEFLKSIGIEHKTTFTIGVGGGNFTKRIYGPIGVPLDSRRVMPAIMHEYEGANTGILFSAKNFYVVSADGTLTLKKNTYALTVCWGLTRQNYEQSMSYGYIRDFQGTVAYSDKPGLSLNFIKIHGTVDGQLDIPARIYAENADIYLKLAAPLRVEISGKPASTEVLGADNIQIQPDTKLEICSLDGNIRLEYISHKLISQ